ncbi:hypothetical protein EDD18DRAFT_179795 [Armillaria luteobubalina]|uniref:GPI anchored protein n=1 Tax=Armillaria luteobubalina TaxID=153913 RepID=A0AA39UPE9_9AGAR|nr:hypothetical protein EDD18DRAFT_179795 [Armillaria luteobubalina]
MKERGLGISALVPGCGVYKPCVGCQRGISSLFALPVFCCKKMQRLSLFFVAVAGLQGALGQTSLYVPGFDAQALSVEVAGVADGHTTFIIQPATDATDTQFVGTATLVEGSDYASLTYVDPDASAAFTVGYACTIASGVAVCSGEAAGVTILETETVSAFGVEGGATETAAGSVATGTSSTAKSGSSSTAKAGSGSSSGTATSSAASSTHSNSSSAISASSKTVLGAIGVLLGLVSVL